MRLSTLAVFASSVAAQAAGQSNPPIRNIFTFPKNHFIENIAVRANSQLLVTSMSVPHLFAIDPNAAVPNATIVYTFTNSTGLAGIAEIKPDVFALVTGTWDLTNTRAELGSLAVWTVDFRQTTPSINFLTQIANSTIFNGLVRHPTNPRLLLAADSALGAVWRVDLLTGSYGVAFSSPLLTPTGTAFEGLHLGINGLTARANTLYFTNSAQKFFGKVNINHEAIPTGPIQIISNSTAAPGTPGNVVYDDIALDKQGKVAWIASHPDYAVGVRYGNGSQGAQQRVIQNATLLLNPTAAAFGRGSKKEEKTLYITNGGEFTPEFDLINEGVVAIDLS
ncbi:hypothetical protein V8F20_005970 [Naviculisporaceae sp. PSN 640]